MEKTKSLLKKNGKIIAIEPASEWFSKRSAFFVFTIKIILSFFNKWYKKLNLLGNKSKFLKYLKEVLQEFKEISDENEKRHSPDYNVSKTKDVLKTLRNNFKEIKFKYGYCFVPIIVGGARDLNKEYTLKLNMFLKIINEFGVK